MTENELDRLAVGLIPHWNGLRSWTVGYTAARDAMRAYERDNGPFFHDPSRVLAAVGTSAACLAMLMETY